MLHNTREEPQPYNTREKLLSRRQHHFKWKKRKKKETRESNSIYMYLNDEKLMNCVNAFFTRANRKRMRWYKNKIKKKNISIRIRIWAQSAQLYHITLNSLVDSTFNYINSIWIHCDSRFIIELSKSLWKKYCK